MKKKKLLIGQERSVVSTKKIKPGEIITKKNISTKRPSPKKGQIAANRYFMGKVAKKQSLRIKYSII